VAVAARQMELVLHQETKEVEELAVAGMEA
jgi:hypothetical protein